MKKEIEFHYLEVLNETEQLMVFSMTFDREPYGKILVLNTALPVEVQDEKIRKIIRLLEVMTRKDAKKAL